MHRGGGSAGGAAGGGIVGGAGGSHRALELEHPSAMPGAPGFHWGAMLAGHHAAAAAGMMQPPMSAGGEYVPAAAHHGPAHPAMPMDLHVHQGFPYYRLVPLVRRFVTREERLFAPPIPANSLTSGTLMNLARWDAHTCANMRTYQSTSNLSDATERINQRSTHG
ncbi:hypothetical protein HN011_004902 [Eciton burchellii]|nr:hypothetical protein HN011_004902 [Eciton burchellii]